MVISELKKTVDDLQLKERTRETVCEALKLVEKLLTPFKSRFSSQFHHFVLDLKATFTLSDSHWLKLAL